MNVFRVLERLKDTNPLIHLRGFFSFIFFRDAAAPGPSANLPDRLIYNIWGERMSTLIPRLAIDQNRLCRSDGIFSYYYRPSRLIFI